MSHHVNRVRACEIDRSTSKVIRKVSELQIGDEDILNTLRQKSRLPETIGA